MPVTLLLIVLLLIGTLGWYLGRNRALARANGEQRALHSRPHYYGTFVAIAALLPSLGLTLLWTAAEPHVISSMVAARLPDAVKSAPPSAQALTMSTIGIISNGLEKLSREEIESLSDPATDAKALFSSRGVPLATKPEPHILDAARASHDWTIESRMALSVTAIVLALSGLTISLLQVTPKLRSRNAVEGVARAGLIACSAVAILTTVGIVFSMLFESLHFFQSVSLTSFLFGTTWDPRFSAAGASGDAQGQFGLIPLLWGTLYISFVALLVAVPVGLFSAIYMAEYASRPVRGVVKPLLELLAGIPTIVYGFFALITLGPFLRDLGAAIGLGISASSVLTAGLVIGVMLIPFVSSLSDDIINSVPQSLRDGSYGLGATRSETIKQVVMPAALPGIVGAILLAASRAIGETMIVVLAAGIAPNISWNPGEPATTITVKIVSQLTGDLEFNSPQTLVAFALGLTLFVITLALNVYALYVVRTYREQYD